MIVVHAGHRLDPQGQSPTRFPADRVPDVRNRLRDLLVVLEPVGVVTAAAAGADLLMADAAIECGIPLHVVLPLERAGFRRVSVADQGRDWTTCYDRVIEWVTNDTRSSLRELDHGADDDGFRAGNQALLDRARELGEGQVLAVTVRRCAPEQSPSLTDDFVDRARAARLFVVDIDPLGN